MSNNISLFSLAAADRNQVVNSVQWLLALFLFSLTAEVLAQGNVLEEITVTAQKREENIQDVGIAVSAFSGEQMHELGIQNSFDIAAFTPGVHISGNLAGQNTQFTIRGVTQNDFNDIVEAPISVYLDDGYFAVAQAQTFAVFDIERSEILKGPQGTLFGRNATGGAVNYFSRKPTFDKVDGYVDVTYGRFDTAADANQYRVEAAVGGPLTDKLAGRVAIMYDNHDGYLQNDYPGRQGLINGQSFFTGSGSDSPGPGAGADMGDDDTFAGRGTLLLEPNDDLSITVSVNGATSNLATGPYQSIATIGVFDGVGGVGELTNVINAAPTETREGIAADGSDFGSDQANTGTFMNIAPRPVPGGDFFGYLDPDGSDFTTSGDFAFKNQGSTDAWGVNGHIVWDLSDSTTLTLVSDYKNFRKKLFIDVDSAPVNQLANYSGVDANTFTQEIRLNGETDRSRWVAGFYYLHIFSDSDNGLKGPVNSLPVLFTPGFFPTSGVDIGIDARLKTNSFSLFGQGEWDFTDNLTFILGARIIQEEKRYKMQQNFYASVSPKQFHQGTPFFSPRTAAGLPTTFRGNLSKTLWSGKVGINWTPTDDLLLYASVNRGVKAGSFNAPLPGGLPIPDSLIPYDEEVLVSYEAGFKSTWFNGTTRFNGTAFYYDYSDYQAFLFTGVGGVVVNADQTNVGVEFEIQTSPIEGLDVMFNAAWYDATVEDVPLRIGSPLPPRDVDPTYAPEVQTSALVRYAWPMFNGQMSVQTNISYTDSFFYNLRNFDADKFDASVMVNTRLAWTSPDEHWEAAFKVNNVTDEREGIQGFDLATLCGCNEVSYRAPRWYGLNVKYSY
ncbi:MAG: TonB-dependent receptor [Gammaproteobacteria bacterium]